MDSPQDSSDSSGKMPFPFKLFQMLKDADEKGFKHLVSWNVNGKSFKVHDSAAFTKFIVPKYFKQTRYKSFQRQLCLYGFDRVLTGNNKGSRYHKYFVRGEYKLVNEIKYIGIKLKALQQIQQEGKKNRKDEKKNISRQQADDSSSATTASADSSFRSTITPTCSPSSVEKRIISPAMSPVASEDDLLHHTHANPTPIAELRGLDDLGLFEGMGFHMMEPMSGHEERIEKDDFSSIPWLPAPKPTATPHSIFPPRQVSCGDKLSDLSSKEMYEAWQRGFEHALQMPQESCWSFVSENEANF